MSDQDKPLVATEFRYLVVGGNDVSHREVAQFFQSRGMRVIAGSRGLRCAICHGDGAVIRPDLNTCIVTPDDKLPCPAGCDNGFPSHDAMREAMKRGEL